MFDIIARMRADAAQAKRTVILPEGRDERILRAAIEVNSTGIARPILLGKREEIEASARGFGLDISAISLLDSDAGADLPALQAYLKSRKYFADASPSALREFLREPLTQACCLLATGEVDACVAGAVYTTPQVIQNGLRVVGTAKDSPLLSSYFLMVFASQPAPGLDFALYADCGIVVRPDAEQLAQIAISTAATARRVFGLDPRVALLSFSTTGSAQHEDAVKVGEAKKILDERQPDLKVIGEVQFDAALLPAIRQRKISGESYAEPGNVYIFPNLDAGNIAYKITERVGGAKAIGPLLQGLNKPLNDLSRGADVEAVINSIAVSCLQARP